MDVQEIVDLVQFRLAYKNWSFVARPRASYRADHPQVVEVRWQAYVPNSSPPHVDPRPTVIATGVFTVFPGAEDVVVDQIMAGIREGEEHEMREFMRIDGFAPYHPHHSDGDRRWAQRRF